MTTNEQVTEKFRSISNPYTLGCPRNWRRFCCEPQFPRRPLENITPRPRSRWSLFHSRKSKSKDPSKIKTVKNGHQFGDFDHYANNPNSALLVDWHDTNRMDGVRRTDGSEGRDKLGSPNYNQSRNANYGPLANNSSGRSASTQLIPRGPLIGDEQTDSVCLSSDKLSEKLDSFSSTMGHGLYNQARPSLDNTSQSRAAQTNVNSSLRAASDAANISLSGCSEDAISMKTLDHLIGITRHRTGTVNGGSVGGAAATVGLTTTGNAPSIAVECIRENGESAITSDSLAMDYAISGRSNPRSQHMNGYTGGTLSTCTMDDSISQHLGSRTNSQAPQPSHENDSYCNYLEGSTVGEPNSSGVSLTGIQPPHPTIPSQNNFNGIVGHLPEESSHNPLPPNRTQNHVPNQSSVISRPNLFVRPTPDSRLNSNSNAEIGSRFSGLPPASERFRMVSNDFRSQTSGLNRDVTLRQQNQPDEYSPGTNRLSFVFGTFEITAPHASQETLSTAASQTSIVYNSPSSSRPFPLSPTSSEPDPTARNSTSTGAHTNRTGTIVPNPRFGL